MALHRALLLAIQLAAVSFAVGDRLTDERNLGMKLLQGYDRLVRPRGTQNGTDISKVDVTVNMYIRTISHFDNTNGEYTAQITMRQEWVDERLIFQSPTLHFVTMEPDTIWIPDTFFTNEQQARKHEIDTPNTLIRVHNGSGQVLYSTRLTLTLSCPMYLKYFPFDRQTCNIDIGSYAKTTNDIEYKWKATNPVQRRDGLGASQPIFDVQDIMTVDCSSRTNTGTYSCLRATLSLKRISAFYVYRLIIPSFLLVIGSLLALEISHEAMLVRVSLGGFFLVAFTILVIGISSRLPSVNQGILIEMWIFSCFAFIVATLVESALVHFVYTRLLKSRSYDYIATEEHDENEKNTWKESNEASKASNRARFIDVIAPNFLIILFIVYAAVFWWHFAKNGLWI